MPNNRGTEAGQRLIPGIADFRDAWDQISGGWIEENDKTALGLRKQLEEVIDDPRQETVGVKSPAQAVADLENDPELVRRLIRLGLLEPSGSLAAPLFPRDAAARLARAVRLRRDLGLNYAGAVLACELLARIDELEGRLRRYEPFDNGRR